jgi:outer membrane protein
MEWGFIMRKLLLLIIGIVFVNPAFADILGARLSGGMFKYAVNGTVRDDPNPTNTFDVKNDLGWKDDSGFMGYLYIEHPIPIIPNFRLGTTSLKLGGTGTVTSTVVYNNKTFTGTSTVTSNLDLSHTELALYYEVIDTVVDLDLGLNFKFFNGKATVTEVGNPTNTATTDYSQTVPMLYGALTIPIPATGFKLAGDFTTVSYKNDTFTDYLVRVRYETDFMLGIELGYRSLHIDYQDTGANKYAKLDMKGPYLMAHLSF